MSNFDGFWDITILIEVMLGFMSEEKDEGEDFYSEKFDEWFDLYEHASLSELQREDINTQISDEQLEELAFKVLDEGPLESTEEQLSFLLSSLRAQSERNPFEFYIEQYEATKRNIARRLKPYEKEERVPFYPIYHEIRDFNSDQTDLIKEWLENFDGSEDKKALSQQYHQLIEVELGEERKVSVENARSAAYAVDIYEDTMNVCDASTPIPVAFNFVSKGENPLSKDLISMGFPRRLQELEETIYSPISNHIDIKLRNAIKHGDYYIDTKDEYLSVESGAKEYSYNEFEAAVNRALLAIDVIDTMTSYFSLITYRRTLPEFFKR